MDVKNKYGCLETQKQLLMMLKDFHSFCEKEEIRYSLCSGSLLGAIRHNGFIPWDDDVDVMLDRENQKRLVNEFHKCKGYKIERRNLWLWRVRKESETKDFGVTTIDIFTLDHVPNTLIGKKAKLFLVATIRGMLKDKIYCEGHSLPTQICIVLTFLLGRLLPRAIKLKLFDRIAQIGNERPRNSVTKYDDLFQYLQVYYNADVMKHIVLHSFEDTQLCIVEQYDKVLTADYGDYMTPPPEEKRRPEHGVAERL